MHARFEQIINQNRTANPEEPGANTMLHMHPAHGSTQRVADDRVTSTLTPYKEPSAPLPQATRKQLSLVFAPSCCSRIPNKASPEFLVWPLLNFCWLRGPRTLLSHKVSKERTRWSSEVSLSVLLNSHCVWDTLKHLEKDSCLKPCSKMHKIKYTVL